LFKTVKRNISNILMINSIKCYKSSNDKNDCNAEG